jgi:hypothetical protein
MPNKTIYRSDIWSVDELGFYVTCSVKDNLQGYRSKKRYVHITLHAMKLDRIYRLNHFLIHSNLDVSDIIDLVTNGQVDQDSQHTKLLENCRTL